ncbi:MAG: HAD family hydrolase [Lentisphaerae bacterium]|nr:HAD family hydrolase [Lentisphaerota bacterium]
MERKLLILDLDETLIFSTQSPLDRPADFLVGGEFHVYRRPHLARFLDSCATVFSMAVWTAASQAYGQEVVGNIFPNGDRLEFLWSHDRCTSRYIAELRTAQLVKDLRKVKKKGFPLEQVLMIDDKAEALQRNYGNHIAVTAYRGSTDDTELLDLMRYLEVLKTVENVRAVEKRNWRKRYMPAAGCAGAGKSESAIYDSGTGV